MLSVNTAAIGVNTATFVLTLFERGVNTGVLTQQQSVLTQLLAQKKQNTRKTLAKIVPTGKIS